MWRINGHLMNLFPFKIEITPIVNLASLVLSCPNAGRRALANFQFLTLVGRFVTFDSVVVLQLR